MMKLSQRMVGSFCASLSSSPLQRWTLLSGTTDVSVRVSTHRSTDSGGQPNGVVLSAATSIWLPVPGDHVFAFVRDENARSQVGTARHPHPHHPAPAAACIASHRARHLTLAHALNGLLPLPLPLLWPGAVGRPVARQSGSGGVAHPQRLQPRQLHLPAESE